MRLGQMARAIDKSTKEIHAFLLSEKGVELSTHPNAKIPDEHLEAIENHFKPSEKNAEIVTEKPKKEKFKEVESIQEALDVPTEEVNSVPEKIEYEVPQIEGPKVVGKIDLPESELNRVKPESKPRLKTRKIRRKPQDKKSTKGNTVKSETQEEQRKREIKEMQDHRKREAEFKKELNRKNYEEKSKASAANKPVKKKKKKTVTKVTSDLGKESKISQPLTPKTSKSLFGKLWDWLNDR